MNPALHPLTFSAAACKVFSYKVFFSPLSKKQAAGPPWVSRLFCFYRRVFRYYSVGVGLPDDPNRTCTRSIPSVGADAHIRPLRRPLVALRRARCPHPVCPLSSVFPVMCHCEPVTDVTGVAIRPPALRLRWLPFFLRRKKGRKERRQNPWFWNPFRG